jgi:hypothetical protein
MGFCDYVTVDREDMDRAIISGSRWQTKSLYASGAEFTITTSGKLVEHLYRYDEDPEDIHGITRLPLRKRIPAGEKVIDYHGDILLYRSLPDDALHNVVARFTNGKLEWIRSLEDYPEENRCLLVEQGAR